MALVTVKKNPFFFRRFKQALLSSRTKRIHFTAWKAGAPTDNVDIAYQVGDLLLDITNDDAYVAQATNGSSTTTWQKMSA